MKNTNDNFHFQSIYWHKLQQLKFDIIYYSLHFNRCIFLIRIIKYILAGLTSLSFALLMGFSEIKGIVFSCGIIGIIMQVFIAISNIFPYEDRKNDLREMSNELDKLYNEMENDWNQISNGEINLEDIKDIIKKYTCKQSEIQKNYLKNDLLPEKKRIINLANKKVEEYFKNFIHEETYE